MNSRFVLIAALGLLASACNTVNPPPKAYPDGTLMQAADTKVVYIIFGGKRRQVPDPMTLEALNVSAQVPTEAAAVIAAVPEGEPIPHLPGKIIQKASTGQVFIIESGRRRWIPDNETLDALGGAKEVHGVLDPVADGIPMGSPMNRISKSTAPPSKSSQ